MSKKNFRAAMADSRQHNFLPVAFSLRAPRDPCNFAVYVTPPPPPPPPLLGRFFFFFFFLIPDRGRSKAQAHAEDAEGRGEQPATVATGAAAGLSTVRLGVSTPSTTHNSMRSSESGMGLGGLASRTPVGRGQRAVANGGGGGGGGGGRERDGVTVSSKASDRERRGIASSPGTPALANGDGGGGPQRGRRRSSQGSSDAAGLTRFVLPLRMEGIRSVEPFPRFETDTFIFLFACSSEHAHRFFKSTRGVALLVTSALASHSRRAAPDLTRLGCWLATLAPPPLRAAVQRHQRKPSGFHDEAKAARNERRHSHRRV